MGSVSSSAANPEYQEGKHTDMNKKVPKPGDLIEIFRGVYNHWAVYIGGGNVVHFVVNDVGSCCSCSCTIPVPGGMGVVLKEKLEDVVGRDSWKINNYLDFKYKPQQIYDIMKQAVGFIETQQPYNLVRNNCEHFATNLRYGKPTSRQVIEAGLSIGGVLAGVIAFTGGVAALLLELNRN